MADGEHYPSLPVLFTVSSLFYVTIKFTTTSFHKVNSAAGKYFTILLTYLLFSSSKIHTFSYQNFIFASLSVSIFTGRSSYTRILWMEDKLDSMEKKFQRRYSSCCHRHRCDGFLCFCKDIIDILH